MGQKTPYLPKQVLIYSSLIYAFVFLVLFFGASLFQLPYAIAYGWILGAAIATINYGTIMLQAKRVQQRVEAQIKTPYFGQGYALFRLVLSGAGMLMCVLIKPNDVEVFNLFALFPAYLVFSAVIYLSGAQYKVKK